MLMAEIQTDRNSFTKIPLNPPHPPKPLTLNLMFWGSRIMNLGSEGVYLDEKCRTNPSRHLPGPKTTVKN